MSDHLILDDATRRQILDDALNYSHVQFGSEIRAAELYTEINVAGTKHVIRARGARSCTTHTLTLNTARTTLEFGLTCDLTFFHSASSSLGPVTIIDDPRRPIKGTIFLRRNEDGVYQLPGLSYFKQYLIFGIGEYFFYYPSPWVVISSITTWPPEYHQYHHLEEDTPIYDFNTRQPNVARKGISTISILGPLTEDDEKKIRAAHALQVKAVQKQEGYKILPEDFLKTPPEPQQQPPSSGSAFHP